MQSITRLTRSLDRNSLAGAFTDLEPDRIQSHPIRWAKNQHLMAKEPLKAGIQFHRTLDLLFDFAAQPTEEQRAYLGWVSALRRAIAALGADEITTNADLAIPGKSYRGTSDIVLQGGPAALGVIECKVILAGEQKEARAKDAMQLAAYSQLLAGRGSYDDVWAALAYVEIESRLVRMMLWESARPLIERASPLLRAA